MPLYTDGIVETENRFGDHLTARPVPAVAALVGSPRGRVEAFADGAQPADDLTLLAFRYLG